MHVTNEKGSVGRRNDFEKVLKAQFVPEHLNIGNLSYFWLFCDDYPGLNIIVWFAMQYVTLS